MYGIRLGYSEPTRRVRHAGYRPSARGNQSSKCNPDDTLCRLSTGGLPNPKGGAGSTALPAFDFPTGATDFCCRLLDLLQTFAFDFPTGATDLQGDRASAAPSMGKKPPLSTGCYRLLLQTSGFATDLLPTCYRLFPLKSTMLQCYRLFHILKEKKKILF